MASSFRFLGSLFLIMLLQCRPIDGPINSLFVEFNHQFGTFCVCPFGWHILGFWTSFEFDHRNQTAFCILANIQYFFGNVWNVIHCQMIFGRFAIVRCHLSKSKYTICKSDWYFAVFFFSYDCDHSLTDLRRFPFFSKRCSSLFSWYSRIISADRKLLAGSHVFELGGKPCHFTQYSNCNQLR